MGIIESREYLQTYKNAHPLPPSSNSHSPTTTTTTRIPPTLRKTPGIQRTTSAPISIGNISIVKETPQLVGKSSARGKKNETPTMVPRNKRTAALISEESMVKETPPNSRKRSSLHVAENSTPLNSSSVIRETPLVDRPQQGRNVSDPTFGSNSLILSMSRGLHGMLERREKPAE